MSDQQVDRETPASPDPAPSKPHGDAFLDQSGSRHGIPPQQGRDEEPQEDDGS